MEPSYEDVFRVTHVKKLTGEFCDARSKEVLVSAIYLLQIVVDCKLSLIDYYLPNIHGLK